MEENKTSIGSIIATIIIIALIVLGGLYFWGKRIEQQQAAQSFTPATTTVQTIEQTGIASTTSKAIEKIDFLKFLASKYESANQTQGSGLCPVGSTELQGFSNGLQSISYGDINRDGSEEAVVNYRTCWDGTSGGESTVYVLNGAGNLVDITPDLTKLSKSDQQKLFSGSNGHSYFDIENSQLVLSFPIYKDGDPNGGPTGGTRTITFKWDGNKFVYNTITNTL